MLPVIPIPRGASRWAQRAFGGLDRRPGAAGGAVCAMLNLTGRAAPLLAARPPRRLRATLTRPNGLFALGDDLVWADGDGLFVAGERVGTVSDGPKTFAALGRRLLVWPDRLLWTAEGGLVPLEARYAAEGLVFSDGTYAGEAARANSLTTSGAPFPFRAGDAVTISGCVAVPENDKTPIVREVSEDGRTLRFYENCFTLPEGATEVVEPGEVVLTRSVPELDFLCVNENRVWGCRGDTVFCSKLGDPFNWNVFDGISTDAWQADTGTPGVFTGCAAFLGYPVFFKEDRVFKVYGSRPMNFELMGAATLGVLPGAAGTLAVAGEKLLYLSRAGFVRYAGGFPAPAGEALGETRYVSGAAGSDGTRYFVSARRADGETELLVLCSGSGLWHREDGLEAVQTAWCGGCLWALGADGRVVSLGECPGDWPGAEAEGFTASAETAPFDGGAFGGKYPVRLWIRGAGTLRAEIAYDGGAWETAGDFSASGTGAASFSVPLRRCDRFALRLTGPAPWTVRALEVELVPGRGSRR